jgi:hypothetical protein
MIHKPNNMNTCIYCETIFTRNDNLLRHLQERCKSKKNFDELEKLKERLDKIVIENEQLKHKIYNLESTSSIITNNNNTINNNTKTQINNGTINNSNVTVQLVQFGCENIDEIDSNEVLNIYSKSTGGNILSNILKFINFNENYPQNHNICYSKYS